MDVKDERRYVYGILRQYLLFLFMHFPVAVLAQIVIGSDFDTQIQVDQALFHVFAVELFCVLVAGLLSEAQL